MKYVKSRWSFNVSGDNSTICGLVYKTRFREAWLNSRTLEDDGDPDSEVSGHFPIENLGDLFELLDIFRAQKNITHIGIWGNGDNVDIHFETGLYRQRDPEDNTMSAGYVVKSKKGEAAQLDAIIKARDILADVIGMKDGK